MSKCFTLITSMREKCSKAYSCHHYRKVTELAESCSSSIWSYNRNQQKSGGNENFLCCLNGGFRWREMYEQCTRSSLTLGRVIFTLAPDTETAKITAYYQMPQIFQAFDLFHQILSFWGRKEGHSESRLTHSCSCPKNFSPSL